MKKNILKIITLSVISSGLLLASGWRIPEQSYRSVALGGAYVANSNGADASYYNPANMAWNKNTMELEGDFTYINLPKLKYEGQVYLPSAGGYIPATNESKSEQFFVPTLFFSSKDKNGIRYGISITAPGGLAKRWDVAPQKSFAQKFELKVIELNPVLSYRVNDKFAIGGGVRFVYSEGKVLNDATLFQRDMQGNTYKVGYNLAASYRPNRQSNISVTYRSNINLKEKGNAKIYLSGTKVYDGGANVTVPLPAVLAVALSYTFFNETTLELEYDRTYWSKYKVLDFNYNDPIPSLLVPYFDNPIPKHWKDSDAYRVGLTHKYSDRLTLMVGFAIDKTPIPSSSLGFELPSNDAKIYSCGFEYKYSKNITIGAGYLYDTKDDRIIKPSDKNIQGMDGTFKDISAHLLTFGLKYRF